MSDKDTVLVTGASGFIAMHCILRLLEEGYEVRGTVRTKEKGELVQKVLARHGSTESLEMFEADLNSDEGWNDAVRGCRFVLHVASPLSVEPPKNEDELIVPARDGAIRVLRTASEAGVERVMMTSSTAAVLYGHSRDGTKVYNEDDWSILNNGVGAYEKSKTIAERAAWDLVADLPEEKPFEFATINPGIVFGPVLDPDFSTSGEVVRKLLAAELPGCPNVGWAPVDVRDVADAHLAAMTISEANGKRFLVAIEHASMLDIALILKENFADQGYRVPTRTIPGWVLRIVGLFDKTAQLAVQERGKRQDIDNSRAKKILNWQPLTLEEMVVSMGQSMIDYKVV